MAKMQFLKNTVSAILLTLCTLTVMAQKSKIDNIRLSLSETTDSLTVKYDLRGMKPAYDIRLVAFDSLGNMLPVRTIRGDIGNKVATGTDRTAVWNMAADSISFYEQVMFVKLNERTIFSSGKRKAWIPWFYMATGASAITGVCCHLKSNNIYDNEYGLSDPTNEANHINRRIRTLDTVRNVAYGATVVFATVGVAVHVKHIKENKRMIISYIPVQDGAALGLTYNF